MSAPQNGDVEVGVLRVFSPRYEVERHPPETTRNIERGEPGQGFINEHPKKQKKKTARQFAILHPAQLLNSLKSL